MYAKLHAILPTSRQQRGGCVRLSCVDWRTYSRLLDIFAERPRVRLTYDRGELEICGPTPHLDFEAPFLGTLVLVLCEELGMPLMPGGSTTLRCRRRRRGIEADASFWIAHAHRMAGRRQLDLRTDPPPDLAIEIEKSRSSLKRMPIYAALGVPEVWRVKSDRLTFHTLGPDQKYFTAVASRSFPLVMPADLIAFLQRARQAGDMIPVVRQFREWIRQRRAAAPPAP
jgi:Uma2 family endonuclease